MEWGALLAAVLGGWGEYQRRKRRKAEQEAARTAFELDQIRTSAGTKGSWEAPAVDPRKYLGL